jgi:hypothetical protein
MTQRTHDHEWLVGNALFGCRDPNCAAETSYHACDLRLAPDNQPVCENCWDYEAHDTSWSSLKEFTPFDDIKGTSSLVERLENDKKYLQIAHGVKIGRLHGPLEVWRKARQDIFDKPPMDSNDTFKGLFDALADAEHNLMDVARAALEGK